jgi:hypothetical protein
MHHLLISPLDHSEQRSDKPLKNALQHRRIRHASKRRGAWIEKSAYDNKVLLPLTATGLYGKLEERD